MSQQGSIEQLPYFHIAIPHTGNVRWEIAAWLNYIILHERRMRFSIAFYGCDQPGVPVSSNRNRILRDTPLAADGVLMIDSDIVPRPDLTDVCLLNLDVVLCPTPIWHGDEERCPIVVNLVPPSGGDEVTIPIGSNKVVEVKEGGTGGIFISRAVIEHPEMRAPFQFQLDEDGVTAVGEDHQFCRRARAAGFRVHAALNYVLGHVKATNLKSVYERFVAPRREERQPELIVTGTGRSGTGYAAMFLSSAGLSCGHETLFYFRGLEAARERWHIAPDIRADASWMAAPYLHADLLDGVPVVHQLRHPRKVIESWLRNSPTALPRYWAFFLQHCPSAAHIERQIDRYAARAVLWTEMIEQQRDGRPWHTWRVEDDEAGEAKLLGWLHDLGLIDAGETERDKLFRNRAYNHKRGDPVEARLEDIGPEWRERLLAVCARYGYEW